MADDRSELRLALSTWIDERRAELSPGAAEAFELPTVCDFILGVAIEDAADGPGKGVVYIAHVSSQNAHYRTHGLLMALEVAFRQPGPDDD